MRQAENDIEIAVLTVLFLYHNLVFSEMGWTEELWSKTNLFK